MRDNDMVAIMLFSPEATMLDLEASGINGNNTGIKEEKEYLKLKDVQENNKFKDDEGNFSEAKFHEFYTQALKNYNTLTAGWQPIFHENNIFAPATQRRNQPKFTETTVVNPFQQTASFKDLGEWGPKTKSVREIAESLKVYDTETGKWLSTPEDSFFGTIGMGPLVLATWDFNADKDGNPTDDPEKIAFKKGDYKLNENGTFYYETLGGRSSHGKEILHYSDIITKEGSTWNKIDFLDSDDLEKSVMGTVAKNVALVGSLFIPYVGYALTGATILLQSLKLGATLGKMLMGSENATMNTLLAFASATDLHESTSDYARENTWSWENLIQTAGDAIGQLRQQRVLFETIPWAMGYGKLGKGKGIFSGEGQEALKEELTKKHSKILLSQNANAPQNFIDYVTKTKELQMVALARAIKEANDLTKNLTNFSAAVSKAYMTGITVNDMYDEAKEAGMGDFGAMGMTLGYAAAEYALLSTGIGELILPELRAQRLILKKLSKPTIDLFNRLESAVSTPKEKENFFWKAFNAGKKLYYDNRSGLGNALTNAAVGGVGEGVEEVTEEFLADAFRTLHDLGHWSDKKMLLTEGAFDRYAMNFIGGVIGGGVNGLTTDFSMFKRFNDSSFTPELAMKELIHKINNGETKDLLKAVNDNKWADKNLSTKTATDKDGNIFWAQAETKEESQDEAIKTMLRNTINSVVNVLEANGARISDDSLFDANTLKEARFAMLANTSTAARYTEVFTDKVKNLVDIVNKLKQLDSELTDEQKRDTESTEYQNYILNKEKLEKEKKEAIEQILEMKEGKLAARFIGTALLEIHPAVSLALISGPTLDLFVRRKLGKSFRELSEEEKAEQIESYKTYKSGQAKDEIIEAYDTWERIMDAILKNFAPNVQTYEKESDKYTNFLARFLELTEGLTENPSKFLSFSNMLLGFVNPDELSEIEKMLGHDKFTKAVKKLLEGEKDALEKLKSKTEKKIEDLKEASAKEIELFEKDKEPINKEIEKSEKRIKDLNELIENFDEEEDEANFQEAMRSVEDEILAESLAMIQNYEDTRRTAISDLNSEYNTEEEYDADFLLEFAELLQQIEDSRNDRVKSRYTSLLDLLNLLQDETTNVYQKLVDLIAELDNKIIQSKSNLNTELLKATNTFNTVTKGIREQYEASRYLQFYDNLTLNFEELLNSIKETGYLNPVTKSKLKRALSRLDMIIPYLQEFHANPQFNELPVDVNNIIYEMFLDDEELLKDLAGLSEENEETGEIENIVPGRLQKLRSDLEKTLETPDSPILQLLDSFALDITGTQTNFSTLFANIDALLAANKSISGIVMNANSEQILFDEEMLGHIEQAIKLTDLLYSVLMGARSDSAGFELNQQLSTGTPNFGIHFGINSIINEVKKKMGDKSDPFLTIEGNITDNIVNDLYILAKKLKFLQNLYGINNGLKLGTQPRITLHTTQIIYKALRKLYDTVPDDDQIDKSMLDEFFQEGNIINLNLDKTSVDDSVLEQIEEERIKLEDALYDFGQKNKGKNIINFAKYTELFTPSSLILNETTPEFDISSLLGYLASRFAIKSSTFYNAYKDTITDEVAPLSIQELGIYLLTANALNGSVVSNFISTTREGIKKYFKSLSREDKETLFENITGSDKYGKVLASDEMSDFIEDFYTPIFDNITFLEGIAGSGKTRAVMLLTKMLIDKVSPDIMEKAFIVDTSVDNATNLAEEGLGLKGRGYKAFSKETLLQHISNWAQPERNSEGEYVYKENVDYIIENSTVRSAYQLKETVDLPSIIIIDEIGRYTDLELRTIDNFAKKHGISVLAYGDLDLTTESGNVKVKVKGLSKFVLDNNITLGNIDNNDNFEMMLSINRILMLHGPKLGFSMRTRNKQLDKNQSMMLAKLIKPEGDITFSYFEGNNKEGNHVLNGAKVINFTSSNKDAKEDEVIETVAKLIPTLKEKEKIGLIYQDDNSTLYLKLIDRFGVEKFEKYKGGTAQGREARYFVYETGFETKTPTRQLVKALNTGITRAQNGIIIFTKHPNTDEAIGKIKNDKMDLSSEDVFIKPELIRDFSRKRKKMYDNIISKIITGNPEPLKYDKRNPITLNEVIVTIPEFKIIGDPVIDGERFIVEVEPTSLEGSNWLTGSRTLNTVVKISSDLNGFNVKLELKEDDKTEEIEYSGNITDLIEDIELPEAEEDVNPEEDIQQEEIEAPTVEINPPAKTEFEEEFGKKFLVSSKWNPVKHTQDTEEDDMPVFLYTLASMETGGVTKGLNGSLVGLNPLTVKRGVVTGRIDSMHGLSQIFLGATYDDLYEKLLKIHEIFLTSSDRADLNNKLASVFGSNVNVLFGLWSSSRANTQLGKPYGIYERDPNERSDFNKIDSGDNNINNLNISALITVNGKSVLIPIAFLSSPLTIAQHRENGVYYYQEVMDILLDPKYPTIHEAVVAILNDLTIYNKYPALYNLFKLWNFTHNGFFPLREESGKIKLGWNHTGNKSKDTFTISSLNNFGIQIITNRGMRQLNKSLYLTHIKASDYFKQTHPEAEFRTEFDSVEDLLKDDRLFKSEKAFMFKKGTVDRTVNGQVVKQTVLKGRPFMFVSEDFDDDEEYFDRWLLGDEKVRLVYLLPPKLTFKEYITRLIDYNNNRIGVLPGNDTTSFHILKALYEDSEGKQLLEDRLSKIIDNARNVKNELFTILDELILKYNDGVSKGTKNKGSFAEFIKAITRKDLDKIFKDLSKLYDKLSKALRLIIDSKTGKIDLRSKTEVNKRVRTINPDLDILEKIDTILKRQGVNIFDRVKYDKSSPSILDILIPINSDPGGGFNNFKVNGNFLLIDTKVTTPTYGTSRLNVFIDSIVNHNIHPEGSSINTKDSNTQPMESIHDEFIKVASGDITPVEEDDTFEESEDFKSLRDLIGTTDLPTSEEEEQRLIVEYTNKINTDSNIKAVVIIVNNVPKIFNYSDKSEIKNITGEKSLSKQDDTYLLKLGDKIFNVTMDDSSNIISLDEVILQPPGGNLEGTEINKANLDTIDFEEIFEDFSLFNLDTDLFGKHDILLNILSNKEIYNPNNESVKNITLKEIRDAILDPDSLYNKDNFINSIRDIDEQAAKILDEVLSDLFETCSIKININSQ